VDSVRTSKGDRESSAAQSANPEKEADEKKNNAHPHPIGKERRDTERWQETGASRGFNRASF
jgi:hypothetical protein